MSRVGLKPISLPSGVEINQEGMLANIKGSKGSLSVKLPAGITLNQSDGQVKLDRASDNQELKALHGLTRALLQNAIVGVSEGYSTKLEIHGVGYRMNVQGRELKLNIGYSHDVTFDLPADISATLDQNVLTLTGIDKQQVFQVASAIRGLKKPEPYKGKGIRFADEYIIRKSGKAAATGKE